MRKGYLNRFFAISKPKPRFRPMLSCQHTSDRNIQSGVLTNQAVKDEKEKEEKEECNRVETLRLDPA